VKRGLPLLLALVVVAATHVPAVLKAGFAYDDGPAILDHPDLRTFRSVPKLLTTEYWGADRANQMYRPLQQWSYLCDGVFFDFEPRASHALHLAHHLAAILVGYALLRRLGLRATTSAAAVAAFGVHPALMDASVWISGRCDVLALLFVAGAFVLLARKTDEPLSHGRLFAAAALFLFGSLAKEVALAAPAAAAVLLRGRSARAAPYALSVYAVYGVLRYAAVDGFLPGIPNEAGVVLHERTLFERVGVGCRAQWILASRLLLPWTSVADHRAHPAALPTTEIGFDGVLSAAAFVAAFVFGAVARGDAPFSRARRLFAAGATFFVPVLQVWPIGAVMPERFLYVPAFFWIAAVAAAAEGVAARRPKVALVVAVACVAALSARTAARVEVYRDDGTFFADVLSAYPLDERAWNNLGVFRMLDANPPDFDGADAAFERAIALKPAYRRGRLNAARAALERMRVRHDASKLESVEKVLGPLLRRGDGAAFALLGRAELERAGIETDDHLRYVLYERAEVAYARAEAFKEAAIAAAARGDDARAADYRAAASRAAAPPK
jgi:hypothetical protein